MSKLKIETGTENKVLRDLSQPVKKVDKNIIKFVTDMEDTMMKSNGVGIAAPQVGMNIRIIVVTLNVDTKQAVNVGMINPEIIYRSELMEIGEEGCLSLPEIFDNVRRHKEITVKFIDLKGREQFLKLADFNARVVQHEIDHLDGVLFTDKIEKGAFLPLANQKHQQI
ncbi:peptide deformylase [Candidatus Peregrinibacteria bacterium]|nr:peptide deformylase [Candidatus Peregrinibacteria bacterium]